MGLAVGSMLISVGLFGEPSAFFSGWLFSYFPLSFIKN
jgi:hypothetical protein